ncbi:terminase gpP N-terminus-related DNA-binding protein [Maridesulfovibrio bastinii]|uniref:terminase gpP N-terminus-related DNA-binding protein n=1 Tax=Maridesulfovibrio bastinii TaxID=47157 RepID=UPI00040B0F75|nr:hypothetical protein [Maridesulfovibrio bastinii]
MGKELPAEVRYQAEELYCLMRMSLKAVAEEVGVAYTTVQRWAKVYGWREMRARIAEAECGRRANLILANATFLQKALDKGDAQSAFAVAALEKVALQRAEFERAGNFFESATDVDSEIRTTDDMAKALRDAVTMKLNRMLNDPSQVDFKAVADIQKASKIIEEMETKNNEDQATDSGNGVTSDTLGKMLDALK